MANDKVINSRLQQKHDTEEHWIKATGFIPKAGEIIIYDGPVPRMKVGNGVDFVNDLEFIDKAVWEYVDQKSQVQIITWEDDD